MMMQVSCFVITLSLFTYASCYSNTKSETEKITWKLSDPPSKFDTKIGKQMPPHHEPDAVLINTGGSGQPRVPDGNFPQFPQGPGGFDPRFGRPRVNRPGFFPGGFGAPRLPLHPNSFGIPGSHAFPGLPNDPNVFISPGQGGPLMPNGPNVYGIQVGQGTPGFTVSTGYFIPNVEPSYGDGSHTFGQPGIFAISGSGTFPNVPNIFYPGRRPDTRVNFPPVRGVAPDGQRNDFQPEAPSIPNQPEFNSNGNFPRHEFYGGPGGREIYDDPIANPFPLTDMRGNRIPFQ